MGKKSIAAILGAVIVIAGSVLSPLFLSDFQNERMLGKVYHSEKENDGVNRTKISLLQKIEMFQKQIAKEGRDKSFDSRIMSSDVAVQGIQELAENGILPVDVTEFAEENQAYGYWIPTDGEENHTIVWKTVAYGKNKQYVILWIEQETGAVIGFKAKNMLFEENSLLEKGELVKKWKNYLGRAIEMTEKDETHFELKQKDTVVTYEIVIEKDEFKIVPVF